VQTCNDVNIDFSYTSTQEENNMERYESTSELEDFSAEMKI
jgi:hypothetical protein